ncbi:MAG TPA: hypothetical protein PLC65_16055 [Bacteroidia bacterium]|nr:hypothetical protein [Bacteroidia bacterium]
MLKKSKPKTDSLGFTRYEKELYKKLGKDNVVIEIKAKVNGKIKVITGIKFTFDKTWGIGRWPNERDVKKAKENRRIYKNVKNYFRTEKA